VGKGHIAIIALLLTAVGAGATYLEENFNGPTFPPAGWEIITENQGCEALGWSRFHRGGGDYCAHGYMDGYYGTGGSTVLATGISLNKGSAGVSFEYYDTNAGGVTYRTVLELWQRPSVYWYRELPRSKSWAPIRVNVPVNASGDYMLGWRLDGVFGNPHAPHGNAHFYVDNIVVEENTDVAAYSFGRVRALYR
jgi:hypothetical protein